MLLNNNIVLYSLNVVFVTPFSYLYVILLLFRKCRFEPILNKCESIVQNTNFYVKTLNSDLNQHAMKIGNSSLLRPFIFYELVKGHFP